MSQIELTPETVLALRAVGATCQRDEQREFLATLVRQAAIAERRTGMVVAQQQAKQRDAAPEEVSANGSA